MSRQRDRQDAEMFREMRSLAVIKSAQLLTEPDIPVEFFYVSDDEDGYLDSLEGTPTESVAMVLPKDWLHVLAGAMTYLHDHLIDARQLAPLPADFETVIDTLLVLSHAIARGVEDTFFPPPPVE